jgi:hypothetical protein
LENKLERHIGVPIIKKDYSIIFSTLEAPLEELNFLVCSSALKVLKQMLKVCVDIIPAGNVKRLLHLTADKYKGNKSRAFNLQLHELIWLFFENQSVSSE